MISYDFPEYGEHNRSFPVVGKRDVPRFFAARDSRWKVWRTGLPVIPTPQCCPSPGDPIHTEKWAPECQSHHEWVPWKDRTAWQCYCYCFNQMPGTRLFLPSLLFSPKAESWRETKRGGYDESTWSKAVVCNWGLVCCPSPHPHPKGHLVMSGDSLGCFNEGGATGI